MKQHQHGKSGNFHGTRQTSTKMPGESKARAKAQSWEASTVPKGRKVQKTQGTTGWKTNLGGCFTYFLFSPLPGEMIQFD